MENPKAVSASPMLVREQLFRFPENLMALALRILIVTHHLIAHPQIINQSVKQLQISVSFLEDV